MRWILEFVGAFAATVGFAIFFNASRKSLLWVGTTGAVGWILSVLLLKQNMTSAWAYLIASMGVAFFAEFFAIQTKNPSTVFSVPGIYPLVPGYGLYQTMYYFTIKEIDLATNTMLETLSNAGAIALGIIVISSLRNIRKQWITKKRHMTQTQETDDAEENRSIFE